MYLPMNKLEQEVNLTSILPQEGIKYRFCTCETANTIIVYTGFETMSQYFHWFSGLRLISVLSGI